MKENVKSAHKDLTLGANVARCHQLPYWACPMWSHVDKFIFDCVCFIRVSTSRFIICIKELGFGIWSVIKQTPCVGRGLKTFSLGKKMVLVPTVFFNVLCEVAKGLCISTPPPPSLSRGLIWDQFLTFRDRFQQAEKLPVFTEIVLSSWERTRGCKRPPGRSLRRES